MGRSDWAVLDKYLGRVRTLICSNDTMTLHDDIFVALMTHRSARLFPLLQDLRVMNAFTIPVLAYPFFINPDMRSLQLSLSVGDFNVIPLVSHHILRLQHMKLFTKENTCKIPGDIKGRLHPVAERYQQLPKYLAEEAPHWAHIVQFEMMAPCLLWAPVQTLTALSSMPSLTTLILELPNMLHGCPRITHSNRPTSLLFKALNNIQIRGGEAQLVASFLPWFASSLRSLVIFEMYLPSILDAAITESYSSMGDTLKAFSEALTVLGPSSGTLESLILIQAPIGDLSEDPLINRIFDNIQMFHCLTTFEFGLQADPPVDDNMLIRLADSMPYLRTFRLRSLGKVTATSKTISFRGLSHFSCKLRFIQSITIAVDAREVKNNPFRARRICSTPNSVKLNLWCSPIDEDVDFACKYISAIFPALDELSLEPPIPDMSCAPCGIRWNVLKRRWLDVRHRVVAL